MYLPTLLAVGHKSSMGHLIQWVSLFFFQIPHKSSMGHLFRCGSSIYSFLIDSHIISPLWVAYLGVDRLFFSFGSHSSPLWVACFGVNHLFFSYQISYKPSIGSLALFSICTCMYVCKRFAQGTCSPYHSTSFRG